MSETIAFAIHDRPIEEVFRTPNRPRDKFLWNVDLQDHDGVPPVPWLRVPVRGEMAMGTSASSSA